MQNLVLLLRIGDRSLLYMINHKLRCNVLDRFMELSTNLGGAPFTVAVSLFLMLWGKGTLKNTAMLGAIALTLSFIGGFFLKRIFERRRPYQEIPDTYTGAKLFKDYAFPSGHTTASFSLAVSYALAYPYLTFLLISCALLVGISRIYLGQHYPSDVLVGGLLGSTAAVLTKLLMI
ncbi:MAG: phosphatase PAP2 family protein [Peptococcaceae bacterium]